MSKRFESQDATQIVADAPGLGILFAFGATVPTDGAGGYSPACIFLDIDSSTVNTCLYVNIGSATSCNFDPLKG